MAPGFRRASWRSGGRRARMRKGRNVHIDTLTLRLPARGVMDAGRLRDKVASKVAAVLRDSGVDARPEMTNRIVDAALAEVKGRAG